MAKKPQNGAGRAEVVEAPHEDAQAAPEPEAEPGEAAPEPRTFLLHVGEEEDAPLAIAFGCDPRVDLVAGEPFTTSDPKLIAYLEADPLFEEVRV